MEASGCEIFLNTGEKEDRELAVGFDAESDKEIAKSFHFEALGLGEVDGVDVDEGTVVA